MLADVERDTAQAGSEKTKSIATAKDYTTSAFAVDVRDRASIGNTVAKIRNKFGRIDYAVNRAGVCERNSTQYKLDLANLVDPSTEGI